MLQSDARLSSINDMIIGRKFSRRKSLRHKKRDRSRLIKLRDDSSKKFMHDGKGKHWKHLGVLSGRDFRSQNPSAQIPYPLVMCCINNRKSMRQPTFTYRNFKCMYILEIQLRKSIYTSSFHQ